MFLALAVVIDTCTGAWSRPPAAFGCVKATSTVTVGPEPDPVDPGLATLPTIVTTPGVVCWLGSMTVTVLRGLTCDSNAGSRAIVTCGVVEVAVTATGPGAGGPPRTAV